MESTYKIIVNFNRQVPSPPTPKQDDNSRPLLHLWQGYRQQVGDVFRSASSGIFRGVRIEAVLNEVFFTIDAKIVS